MTPIQGGSWWSCFGHVYVKGKVVRFPDIMRCMTCYVHVTNRGVAAAFKPVSSGLFYNLLPWLKKIIWVTGVLRRTVFSDWRFDNLCGSHLQSQVVVLFSWKFKNPGERFDWSVYRVAVGKYVMWLAVKTCAEIGYANRGIVKWIINKVLLFPVE